ncbi:hypothetical protein EJ063_12395 [Vibrio aquaticus]|uniref:GlyGly-CTERM sorting domain-containing protein n=1 Tax=Vibrio aquaticus TaxID=2496559 RepID=A0A3S0QCP6_9VIBR|nr:cadherin-like domain-containing protein [Vibrio aquaticus]RTZ15255.1 hypothetical protein EJ063_12395 [Vibrio aquaticus]
MRFKDIRLNRTKVAALTVLSIASQVVYAAPVAIKGYTPPANGYYSQGDVIEFEVRYTENVYVGGGRENIFVPITIGNKQEKAKLSSIGGEDHLTFSYTVKAGDSDFDGIYHQGQVMLWGDAYIVAYPSNTAPTSQKFSGPETLSDIVIDTTAAELSLLSGVPEHTSETEPTLRVNASKQGSVNTLGNCAIKHSPIVSQGVNELTLTASNGAPYSDGSYNDCKLQLEDVYGNTSRFVTVPTFNIDSQVPIFSTFSGTVDENAITLDIETSKNANVSIVVLPKHVAAPSVEQVLQGLDGNDQPAVAFEYITTIANTSLQHTIGGLNYHTDYSVYSVLVDQFDLKSLEPSSIDVSIGLNTDNTLTSGHYVTEPVRLPLSAKTESDAVALFDFTVSDNDGVDGIQLSTSDVRIYSTASEEELNKLSFSLVSPDDNSYNVKGVVSVRPDSSRRPYPEQQRFIQFEKESVPIPDGENMTFILKAHILDPDTVSPNTVYNFALHGGWDITLSAGQTMQGYVTNGAGTTIQFPEVTEKTAVPVYSKNQTPNVSLYTSASGTIEFGGDCSHTTNSSSEGVASYGLTAAGNSLADGIYSCTAKFTESSGTEAQVISLTPFVIDNKAPEIVDDPHSTVPNIEPGTSSIIAYSAIDDYTPSSDVMYTLIAAPDGGSITVDSSPISSGASWSQEDITNQRVIYQHNGGPELSDSFTFTISDGLGNQTSTQTYSIHLNQDSDGDGMRDKWEDDYGFDPADPSDANADPDQDGCDNLCEYNGGTNPRTDEFPPIFDDMKNDYHIQINADSMYTKVIAKRLVAYDEGGSDVTVEGATENVPATGSILHLRPGRHVYSYVAKDPAGNEAYATQIIDIYPAIELAENVVTAEGNQLAVEVTLNGQLPCHNDACEVPLSIENAPSKDSAEFGSDYAIDSCSATTSDSLTADVTLSPKKNVFTLTLDVCEDGIAEAAEHFTLQLAADQNPLSSEGLSINLGGMSKQKFTITEQNLPPVVTVNASDNDGKMKQSFEASEQVTIEALYSDPNKDTTYTEWLLPDELFGLSPSSTQSNSTVTFAASTLEAGDYLFTVKVGDGEYLTETSFMINIMAENISMDPAKDSDGDGITDDQEGMLDADQDGIPDYLDHSEAAKNQMAQDVEDDTKYNMESMTGTQLKLGNSAKSQSNSGPLLSDEDMDNLGIPQPDGVNVGGVFDFEIHQLNTEGQSTSLVIPLRETMIEGGQYTKFKPDTGWVVFVEDQHNYISGAAGYEGYCPPPSSPEFFESDGITPRPLQEGDWCLKITIQDGGPNDDDGIANKSIVDPGGIVVHNYVPPSNPNNGSLTTSGGGSGGSIPLSVLLGLSGLALLRRKMH